MERRFPLMEIGIETAGRLLAGLPGDHRLETLTLLHSGHINTNYALGLRDGRRLRLRIYVQGEPGFHKEVGVLRALSETVSVPRLHLAVSQPELFPYPFAILEWIEGMPLHEALAQAPEAAAQIGEQIAAVLLGIAEQRLELNSFPPFLDYIRTCLFERGAAVRLGPQTTASVWSLAQEHGDTLERLRRARGEILVHGDFHGENIIVAEERGDWRVAGILDWEWAHNGCYLCDLGSLFRNCGPVSGALQRGLHSGFCRAGAPPHGDWIMASRIWDLAAQCEKLTGPSDRGEVTRRTIRLIERCLHDYAR
jgi:aminoglycoside phosphotransferase (APT) family kinase protein